MDGKISKTIIASMPYVAEKPPGDDSPRRTWTLTVLGLNMVYV